MTPAQSRHLRLGKAITQFKSGDVASRTDAPDCITCAMNAHRVNIPENCKQCIRYKS
jgi:hypothetical protein